MNGTNYPIPQSHKTFVFGKVIIDSNFDNGNCSFAQKINSNTYAIWIGTDNSKNNYRVWFNFSIQGIPKNTLMTFQIKNMQNQARLLYEGLTPVFKEQSSIQWKRISHKINLTNLSVTEGQMEWAFSHQFNNNEKHYFAFYYPWSLTDNSRFINSIILDCQEKTDIYIHRGNAISSLEGRPVQMLTISSKRGLTNKDQNFDDLNLFVNSTRPKQFDCDKKCIIIGARVHPGEVPGSHVMCGIIQQLTQQNEIANSLRDKFVFYIFPILNPDGVARGHFRVDTNGINLNRCYINPSYKQHSSIYAIKKVIMHCHFQDKYFAFLDLHAQASRKGNFIYGNSTNQLSKQVEACLFPKILSMNSQNFEYEGSNFMQKHMYCKDKADHMSKEGCGRVAIFNATKNPNSWTIECSYNIGQTVNVLQPRKQKNVEPIKLDEDCLDENIIKNYKNFEQKQSKDFYTVTTYRNLGKQICQSILDFIQANPHSRIVNPDNYFKSINNVRLNLAIALIKMAPNRFENHYRKIFYLLEGSQNPKMASRCLKALYFFLIKKAKIPNLVEYLRDEDNTIIYPPPQKQNSRQLVKRKTINSQLHSPSKSYSSSPTHPKSNPQKNLYEQDAFFEMNEVSMLMTAQSNKRQINNAPSATLDKKKQTPTIKIVQIDKQIYLRSTAKQQFKMIGINNLQNRYESQGHITNYNNYKKKGPSKGEELALRRTYNEVFRLQILPKLITHHKAVLNVSPVLKQSQNSK